MKRKYKRQIETKTSAASTIEYFFAPSKAHFIKKSNESSQHSLRFGHCGDDSQFVFFTSAVASAAAVEGNIM